MKQELDQQPEQTPTHTPLPWMPESKLTPDGADLLIVSADYIVIADCRASDGRQGHYPECVEADANAELICRAVNSHQELLDGCREALALLQSHGLGDHQVACNLEATLWNTVNKEGL